MSIIQGYDPTTLQEKVDLNAVAERLEELGALRSSSALNEKVELLRLVGRLDEAWELANQTLRTARFSTTRDEICLARIRRAMVQRDLGKADAALIELNACVDEARAHEWAEIEARALIERGKAQFLLGEYKAALTDFRGAVTIRVRINASASEVDNAMMATAIAESFVDDPIAKASAPPLPTE